MTEWMTAHPWMTFVILLVFAESLVIAAQIEIRSLLDLKRADCEAARAAAAGTTRACE
jgi:hypothetical protein